MDGSKPLSCGHPQIMECRECNKQYRKNFYGLRVIDIPECRNAFIGKTVYTTDGPGKVVEFRCYKEKRQVTVGLEDPPWEIGVEGVFKVAGEEPKLQVCFFEEYSVYLYPEDVQE